MSRSKPGRLLSRQRGLTLVELMVALVMGLVLLGGVVTVFVANKETYQVQDALARVQENGRFALSLLTRELRTSAHIGCSSRKPVAAPRNTVAGSAYPATSSFADFTRRIDAFDGVSAWPTALSSNQTVPSGLVGGTDLLVVRVVDGNEARAANHSSPTADVEVRGIGTDFQSGDILLVSDCEAAAVFQLVGAPSTSGTTTTLPTGGVDLGKQFPSAATAAEVQKIRSTAYYIAPSSFGGEPALWRWNGIGLAQEVVAGIDNLQVRFGLSVGAPLADGSMPVTQYATVNEVETGNLWGNVVSVQVSLLVRSESTNISSGPQSFDVNFDGDTADAGESFNDGRLRQLFTATVSLRNAQS
jgi:type IV pilus assembly protein PilW